MPARTFNLQATTDAAIEAAVASGRYASASDYLADLVAMDQKRCEAAAYLARKVTQNRASGEPVELSPEALGEQMRAVHERVITGKKVG